LHYNACYGRIDIFAGWGTWGCVAVDPHGVAREFNCWLAEGVVFMKYPDYADVHRCRPSVSDPRAVRDAARVV